MFGAQGLRVRFSRLSSFGASDGLRVSGSGFGAWVFGLSSEQLGRVSTDLEKKMANAMATRII